MSLREAAQAALRCMEDAGVCVKASEALRDALAEAPGDDAGQEPKAWDSGYPEYSRGFDAGYRVGRLGSPMAKAEPVAWTPVTTRLPPYGDEKKVVCYTEGHDYAGTQFITLRASDFYEYDPGESDEPGTPEAKTVSHWIYEDDLIAAARGNG